LGGEVVPVDVNAQAAGLLEERQGVFEPDVVHPHLRQAAIEQGLGGADVVLVVGPTR
jgi:hypothetical protein